MGSSQSTSAITEESETSWNTLTQPPLYAYNVSPESSNPSYNTPTPTYAYPSITESSWNTYYHVDSNVEPQINTLSNIPTSPPSLPPRYRTICCGCVEDVQLKEKNFYRYNDDRVICEECLPTAVFDYKKLEAITRDVCSFYKSVLDIDISAVTRYYLILLVHHGQFISEEARVVGGHGETVYGETTLQAVKLCIKNEVGKKVTVKTCEMHAPTGGITILYGLSKLLTGATLAYQMMHALLALQLGYNKRSIISREIEEGICLSMIYKYIEYRDSRQLHLMKKTKGEHWSTFYPIKESIEKHGFTFVLRSLISRGSLPQH